MNANAPDPGFVGQISLCGDSNCFSYVGQSVNACVFARRQECRRLHVPASSLPRSLAHAP